MKNILKTAGIFNLLYYVLIISYAGIRTTFAKFWIVSGAGWAALSLFPKRILEKLRIPMILGTAFFIFKELCFLKAAHERPEPNSRYMIILGAQVKGKRPSRSLLRRIEAGADYLKKNPDTKVIASGGQGWNEEITEAECICQTLIHMGIDQERIYMEPKSTSTWENLLYSMEIGGESSSYVVVTNGFHMYRTIMTGKRLGMKHISGLSAPSEPVLLLNYYVREFFAWVLYRRRMK